MVWGRRWLIVVCPILCLVTGFGEIPITPAFMPTDNWYICSVFKILEISEAFLYGTEREIFLVVYISCILATTLWCTILIVIRILTAIRAANGRLGDYHHIIEVLVESSALYSVSLIIYIALEASNNAASVYFDTLAAITTVSTDILSFLNTYI